MMGLTSISVEWIAFLASMASMFKTKDMGTIQSSPNKPAAINTDHYSLPPTFINFPISVPAVLIIPHLTYMTIFTLSILID